MDQPVKLPLIDPEHSNLVPFNYLYLEFDDDKLKDPSESIDVVNGRHPEKTFVLETIQNPQSSKIFLYKSISRYDLKI